MYYRWCLTMLTIIIGVKVLLNKVTRTKVNESNFIGDKVDQDILWFNISESKCILSERVSIWCSKSPVNNSMLVAANNNINKLFEVVTCSIFFKIILVWDDFEQVFVQNWTLHDKQETVFVFANVVIQILDNSFNI